MVITEGTANGCLCTNSSQSVQIISWHSVLRRQHAGMQAQSPA